MNIISSDVFPEVFIIEPDVFSDKRGYFLEIFNLQKYKEKCIPSNFVQDNLSLSFRGVLRGLHYQIEKQQAKLVSVIDGEVFDVAADIRKGSPSFGKWTGVFLSGGNHRQLFIPEGFAHGFCVLSEKAIFTYKCSDFYSSKAERGIIWNDNLINIDWPTTCPIISEKDNLFPSLSEIPESDLPVYK